MKVRVILFAVGALGTIPRELVKCLEDLKNTSRHHSV